TILGRPLSLQAGKGRGWWPSGGVARWLQLFTAKAGLPHCFYPTLRFFDFAACRKENAVL
ncbi:MAG: hypothetical protein AAAB11_13575, partial [Rhizobium giardinii]